MNTFFHWLDDRTGYRAIVHEMLYEPIPGGARWRYVWGSTLTFTFAVQLITGLFLWMAYAPSAQTAWESVYYIHYVMEGGWLVRGIHHFAAQAMVVLLALHFMQVVIDGAYRAPREVNFWLGLILMQIVLALSLTGYLLPWDQKGYYATKVATNILGLTPVVGQHLQALVQGGAEYGHHTLTRFFALHAGVLPGLLILFLGLHIYVFRRHSITVTDPDRKPETTFWPEQVLKDAVACLGVLATILFLTYYFHGAGLSAPADPAEEYSAARPEWYFLFLFRFLKFEFIENMGLVVGAIIVPGALMGVIALMPILGHWKLGHRFNVAFLLALMLGVVALTGVAWYEDNISETKSARDFRSARTTAEDNGKRTVELAEALGIQTTARDLLRQDPKTQGPILFAKHCAACHRYDGHDGTGKTPTKSATAADLGNFGSRDWLRSVLVDYKNHFASLANATWDGEDVGPDFLEDGEMVSWSEDHKERLLEEANQESLNAIIEFVVAQSGRTDLPPINEELAAKGRDIFELGELAVGELDSSCVDCHALTPAAESEPLSEEGTSPMLTGYGGMQWLKGMIADPAATDYYGNATNAMPAFADKLTDEELDLLVRWMAGEYFEPKSE